MLISLALVAPGLLFLNYAIEKCSILCPNFQAQFWTQCNCFFSILWPHFQAQFWTQFWGSALTPPYLFFLQSLKLDPKIGPQNGPKITSENLATNCIVSENLATNWIFFQLRPSRIRVAKPTKARKANIPHSTEFY
jgi:hypothetical protein